MFVYKGHTGILVSQNFSILGNFSPILATTIKPRLGFQSVLHLQSRFMAVFRQRATEYCLTLYNPIYMYVCTIRKYDTKTNFP